MRKDKDVGVALMSRAISKVDAIVDIASRTHDDGDPARALRAIAAKSREASQALSRLHAIIEAWRTT
jgi:hypothetical protein